MSDRDDELLDRIEAGLAPADDAEAAARAPYERLIGRLQVLDRREPADGWGARVDARVRAERDRERRRRRWWAGGVTAALGAALVVVIIVRRGDERAPATGPRVAVVARDGTMRSGAAAVGDRLRIDAPRTEAHVELRVYRDAVMIARCPGDEACAEVGGRLAIELPLTDAGAYQVLVLSAATPLPTPGPTLDADILAARKAGATIARQPLLLVEP